MRDELDHLSDDPAERAAQIDGIVARGRADPRGVRRAHHAVMLEVMTRRYYRVRELTDVQVEDRGGRPLLHGALQPRAVTPRTVFATTVHTEPDAPAGTDPRSVQGDLRRLIGQLPEGTVAARPVRHPRARRPTPTRSGPPRRSAPCSGASPTGSNGSRWRCGARPGDERSAWFTFRPDRRGPAGGRRPHPARPAPDGGRAAGPLAAARLRAHPAARRPSTCTCSGAVGRNVPDDQRLVILTDVRDLTVLRDESGRIRALPQLEHVLDACLDALRTARAADRGDARTDWNRVLLYVWPVVDVPLDELGEVVRILAPRTGGAGAGAGARPVPARGVAGGGAAGVRAADVAAAGRGPHACASPTRRRRRCASSTPTRRR